MGVFEILLLRLSNNDDDGALDFDGDLALEEAKPKLKPPPMYQVIVHNDDFTPMEFVVHILELFFHANRELATQIMLTVHTKGKGVCGVYPKDIAETKAMQVNQYAKDNEHPLLCDIEVVDD